MKLGLLISYNDSDLELLSRLGLQSCQLLIFPDGPLSPTQGANANDWKRARERFDSMGVEVSAVGSYTNMLSPDLNERGVFIRHMEGLRDVAEIMGCRTVGSFAGRDPLRSPEESLPAFKEVFSSLTAKYEERGLRLAIENCPMFHGWPYQGINIAYTPALWDLMFEAVPSHALGLEFDPSHLICLGIDYLRVLREYGSRVYHVHAKDAELIVGAIYRYGWLDGRVSRHRMPGMGQVDWTAVIATLQEIGYRGNLDIEGRHDPEYSGDREEEGLRLAVKALTDALSGDLKAPHF